MPADGARAFLAPGTAAGPAARRPPRADQPLPSRELVKEPFLPLRPTLPNTDVLFLYIVT